MKISQFALIGLLFLATYAYGQTIPSAPFTDELEFISTQLPSNAFSQETSSSSEGEAIILTANVQGTKQPETYIHMFFPRANSVAKVMFDQLFGKYQLIESNGWKVNETKKKLTYPWIKYQVDFTGTRDNVDGIILIGEEEGRTFQVVVQYARQLEKWFQPISSVVLENLKLNQAARDSVSEDSEE